MATLRRNLISEEVGIAQFSLATPTFAAVAYTMAEFKSLVIDTKSNKKNITKSISIHIDYQDVHFW